MSDEAELIFTGSMKRGMFGREKFEIEINPKRFLVRGAAFPLYDGDKLQGEIQPFYIELDDLLSVKKDTLSGSEGVLLEAKVTQDNWRGKDRERYFIVGLNEPDNFVEKLTKITRQRFVDHFEVRKDLREKADRLKEEMRLQKEQRQKEIAEFLENVKVEAGGRPEDTYVISESDLTLDFWSVAGSDLVHAQAKVKDDNFNKFVLRIKRPDLLWFEYVEQFQYVPVIRGKLQLSGGELIGAGIGNANIGAHNITSNAISDLVDGYEPYRLKPLRGDLELINEEPRLVEYRRLTLRYKEERGQIEVLELPVGMFNFMLTHFREKYYPIAIELEKARLLKEAQKSTN